ncbi:bacteriophage abortive infection AbiH family protein [Dehalobacter sp.]|uniref:bacteriophage abortive infection AbiH family protein n=1 Tax=Dehalobacter sp. TaxID=1962289 RepID=UPI0025907203|nr:bacteriophage abortive infection AbiH family protein [Dehalobacter sp.]MCG1024561.1 bacteriophage abortive infection AbiH family protein [Dehalobacter sp.]
MKLFIIGNGFDIGHGLPTGYWDFRTFLDLVYPEFLRSFEEHYDIYPGMSAEAKKKTLWSRFESNLANIDEDTIIDIGTSIELNLESGDVGIEDTLYSHFTDEYQYIEKLAGYLKQWVRSIKIRDCLPRTSIIDKSNRDLFLTFNYTAVLENVYGITPGNIVHIHGSLRDYTHDPVLGHSNKERLQKIRNRIAEAEKIFDEKECSICRVVNDYYNRTFKDTRRYTIYLSHYAEKDISDIIVIGHSLDGIDMPYFSIIDSYTGKNRMWTVYCYDMDEAPAKRQSLIDAGIDSNRIVTVNADDFYDLKDDEAAKRRAFEIKFGF